MQGDELRQSRRQRHCPGGVHSVPPGIPLQLPGRQLLGCNQQCPAGPVGLRLGGGGSGGGQVWRVCGAMGWLRCRSIRHLTIGGSFHGPRPTGLAGGAPPLHLHPSPSRMRPSLGKGGAPLLKHCNEMQGRTTPGYLGFADSLAASMNVVCVFLARTVTCICRFLWTAMYLLWGDAKKLCAKLQGSFATLQ